jgi:hypothetical protein
MCSSAEYLTYPKAQYHFQLAYPTVGTTHQMGVGPAHFENYANKISAEGGTAIYIWQKTDYIAGASSCALMKDKK